MANRNFVVQKGLTVGPLTIDAATGSISTTGTVSVTGLAVTTISKNDNSITINDSGTGSNVSIVIDGVTEHTIDANGVNIASGDYYAIAGTSVLDATTLGSGVTASSLTSVGTLTSLTVSGNLTVNGSQNTINSTIYETTEYVVNQNATFGNILNSLYAGSISTANAVISGGYISELANLSVTGTTIVGSGSSNVVVAATTISTNIRTGALVVAGGVGIAGATHVGGNLSVGTYDVNTRANLFVHSGELGTTSGTSIAMAEMNNVIGNNQAYLRFIVNRVAAGFDWTTSSTKIQQRIDVTDQGYIEFNPLNSNNGVDIGNGTTPYIRAFQGGNVVIPSTTASSSTTTGALVVAGGVGIAGNVNISGSIVPSANVSSNLGDSTHWFNTFYGVATQAKYADLAENYQADRTYQPGTVLMFGGPEEVTVASEDTTRVAGVVSTNPAHLMNGQLTGAGVVALALTGRVPCNIIGPVAKGDLMVSAGFGYAKVNNSPTVGTIIGKALQDFAIAGKGVIEVVVGRF